jgi:hypothetical protein
VILPSFTVTLTWVVPNRLVTAVPVSVAVTVVEPLELDEDGVELEVLEEPPVVEEDELDDEVEELVPEEVEPLAPGRLVAAVGW